MRAKIRAEKCLHLRVWQTWASKKTFSAVFTCLGHPTGAAPDSTLDYIGHKLIARKGLITVEPVRRPVSLLCGLVLVLTSFATRAEPPYQPGLEFPIIWIATGESARVNALNLGTGSSGEDSSCSVTLQFLAAGGQMVKQTVVALRSRAVASLELSRGELPGEDARAEIRAVLLFGYYGGAPPGPGMLQRFDCKIVPSLEVYDNHTGRTRLTLTDAKPLPPPPRPAQ